MHLGSDFYTDEELRKANFKYLGKNVKVKRNASLYFTENMILDDWARIDDFTVIVASSQEVRIGKYVHIPSLCYIAGSHGFEMDDFSGLSPAVYIFTGSDDYTNGKLTNSVVAGLSQNLTGGPHGKVVLEKHVLIGSNTVILPKVTIGIGSSVGANSLVTKSLEPWGVYAGSPVKFLKERSKTILENEATFLKQLSQSIR
jgi:acetyltransferase-like isoleucine patch superfamily enzyme